MTSNIAYLFGFFTLPVAFLLAWALVSAVVWFKSPKRDRIIRWRTRRIRRLEAKVDRIARNPYRAHD